MPVLYQQFQKGLCLLALAFLFVACGSPQAQVNPTPTTALFPTATPTLPPPTFTPPGLATPDVAPYWTFLPNPVVLTDQGCSKGTAHFECILTITYNSRGIEGSSSWKATPLSTVSRFPATFTSLSLMQGILVSPTQSAKVRVDVFVQYCSPSMTPDEFIEFSLSIPATGVSENRDVSIACSP